MVYLLALLTSHRIEMLQHFEEEALKNEAIILEEPENKNLVDLLEGRKSIEEYVQGLNTTLPLFARYHSKMLKKLYSMGKKIFQIEPYLKNLEDIYKAIENNRFEEVIRNPDVEAVREVEKRTTEALIEYHEAFLKGDFDGVVNTTIKFTKMDADRFRIRDYMRAKEIVGTIRNGAPSRIVIEAGQMHILLPEYLKKLLKDRAVVSTISLPESIAKKIGLELVPNPGNELTKKYIMGEKVAEDTEKLLAAKGLIYISLISKDEKIPTKENPYPHLIEETEVSKFVSKLSYESCRNKFEKIWMKRKS
jgi:hypothetical protein